ncbi:MAG: S24/S26 family peptidase [Bacilli bacterium]|nr:S24/S26 family peptidase [Bacilli bacterium]
MNKVRNIVVAIPAIIFVLAIILIFKISFSLQKGEVPKVFGLTFMEVQTGSMEPNIHQYDFIINKAKKEYKVGDAVSFYYDLNGDGKDESVTHRIISFNNDGTITLKGDAAVSDTDIQVITSNQIIGKVIYRSSRIGKLFTTNIFKNRNFLFMFLIGSLIIFMIYQSFNIFKLLKEDKKLENEAVEEPTEEVKEEQSSEDIEAEIARLQAKLKEKEEEKNE